MYIMYCVKCKQKTETSNIVKSISKNHRPLIRGTCQICKSRKVSFIGKTGAGIVDKAIGKLGDLGIELHLPAKHGEYIPSGSFNNLQKYSYCGPGTKYEQRAKEGYKGINELDSMCKLHDRFYNENSDTQSRNISDTALAHRAREIATDVRYDEAQRRFANYIEMIMNSKAQFGLGVKTKNLKRGPKKSK